MHPIAAKFDCLPHLTKLFAISAVCLPVTSWSVWLCAAVIAVTVWRRYTVWRCDVSTVHFGSWSEYIIARDVTFQTVTVAVLRVPFFWDVTLCRSVSNYRRLKRLQLLETSGTCAEQHDVTFQEDWILWRYILESLLTVRVDKYLACTWLQPLLHWLTVLTALIELTNQLNQLTELTNKPNNWTNKLTNQLTNWTDKKQTNWTNELMN